MGHPAPYSEVTAADAAWVGVPELVTALGTRCVACEAASSRDGLDFEFAFTYILGHGT